MVDFWITLGAVETCEYNIDIIDMTLICTHSAVMDKNDHSFRNSFLALTHIKFNTAKYCKRIPHL